MHPRWEECAATHHPRVERFSAVSDPGTDITNEPGLEFLVSWSIGKDKFQTISPLLGLIFRFVVNLSLSLTAVYFIEVTIFDRTTMNTELHQIVLSLQLTTQQSLNKNKGQS